MGIPSIYDTPGDSNNKVGTFESILSGIGSGLIGIPKGLFSLGATLMDLGADTGRAAEVERWFDDLTNLDEKAEATTAGKLTEVLVNIGVPGGLAFRQGTKMANAAMQAKKSDKYLDFKNPILKKGIQDGYHLTGKGKTKQFMTGALLGGAAEGVFVGDVQDVGSLGDLLGGPTEIDRGEGTDAFRDLLNRVKFGTEGALFTGLIGGTGATIRKLRNRNNELDIANSKLDRWIDKVGGWFRSRSGWTPEAFAEFRKSKGLAGVDSRVAKTISRDIDQSMDAIFPRMKTMMENSPTSQARNEFMRDVNKALLSGTAELDDAGKVVWSKMDEGDLRRIMEKMQDLGAKSDDVMKLTGGLEKIRTHWGKLFDELGKTLTPDEILEFKELFGKKFLGYMGSTYDVMLNKTILPWLGHKPARELIARAEAVFMDAADQAKRPMTKEEARVLVDQTINSASMPKGFRLDKPSDALFNVPDFFLARSQLDDAVKGTNRTGRPIMSVADLSSTRVAKGVKPKIDPITGEIQKYRKGEVMYTDKAGNQIRAKGGELRGVSDREVFEDLLGKSTNPMQTILGGTAKLSMIVRRNVFFKDLMKKNEELLEKAYKEIEATGKTNIKPMFIKNENEARLFFGDNYRKIDVLDPAQRTYVGTKSAQATRLAKIRKGKPVKPGVEGATNPFSDVASPWFSTPGMADALEQVGMQNTKRGALGQLYHSLLLYPKATSQIAKTILSPITHMRNFISAGAFATANGIVPFADKEAIKMAYQALQTPLKGTRMQNELYDELLELGVVNTNVRLGDVSRLMKDVGFGETMTSNKGLTMLLRPLSKLKSVGQDLYTAEDDFWKIYSWAVEKKRMETAFKNVGLIKNVNQTFKDAAGNTINLTDDWFKKEAADIVKNNIPNYDFVSDFVKGLRKAPIGNFVSFPAEIARTGTNIVERALRDISFTTKVNGKTVAPFKALGYQRLMGFGLTVAAIPYATVEMFKVMHDVTDEEQAAIRRYVADWSKNSTILPIKDKEGNFKYVDFSHANAYDTLARPVQTVINAVADGRQDNDGIMDDFMRGMFTSMKEFALPFIGESIWTEAATDIILRGGRTRDGFEVYNEQDNAGNKSRAIMKHLVEAQMPFSFPQLKRLDRSLQDKRLFTKSKYDEYGQTYEFGDEFGGLFGFRAVAANPGRTMKYKVADYQQGVRKSGSLFSRVALRGGPIEPQEIVDAYINTNRSLFQVKKDLKLDMDAARTLGISENDYKNALARVSNREVNAIDDGRFRPYKISSNVRSAFRDNAEAIGAPNPLDEAYGAINSIATELSEITLDDLFPDIQNPLTPMGLGMTLPPLGGVTDALSSLNAPAVNPQAVTNQGGNIPYDQMNDQQRLAYYDSMFNRG
tara:strand:- start:78 stop:4214 length:4137 start_codon:yes stop_codon:yes gene_type:complete